MGKNISRTRLLQKMHCLHSINLHHLIIYIFKKVPLLKKKMLTFTAVPVRHVLSWFGWFSRMI